MFLHSVPPYTYLVGGVYFRPDYVGEEELPRHVSNWDLYRVYLVSYPFFCYLCLSLTLDFTSYGEAKDRIQSRLS